MLFLICFVALLILYRYTRNYSYWRIRNVKHDIPLPVFGNHFKNIFGMRTDVEFGSAAYAKYGNEKIVGYYRGSKPVLIVRDLDLIKQIMSKDFVSFYGRGLGVDREHRLMMNIFHAQGDYWRLLRNALTPAFTTAKLRGMFPLIEKCTLKLQHVVRESAENDEVICARDLMGRYTTEFIGACAFGIEMDTINTEKSLFIELGEKIFTITKWQLFCLGLRDIFGECLFSKRITVTRDDIRKIISDIMNIIREQRNKGKVKRNDLVDILLELEKTKLVEGESFIYKDDKGRPVKTNLIFTDEHTTSQLFVFFAGGFETSAVTMSWTLHQLARHPDIQRKVQDEIDRTLAKYNGICYDAIADLAYLEMTIKESLRTFSPAGFFSRECMREYQIPGTGVTIDPGVIIHVPIQAIHMDAKYFDNPTEFRPERFSPEEESKNQKHAFLPFGEGPRRCIASRLGIIESMTGLVAILQNFTVVPAPNSKRNIQVKRDTFLVQAIKGGLPVMFKPRKIV